MNIDQDFLNETYNAEFYRQTTAGSLLAGRRILPYLWKLKEFDSVIDVGCGVGTWLLAAREMGAKTIHGIEGYHVPSDMLLVSDELISRQDLSTSIRRQSKYSLCMCLEVAEHLPPHRGLSLIEDLTTLSDVVAFSAAIPFQGGDGHLNELWPELWAQFFDGHGFAPSTEIRSEIWDMRDIPWWYRQNLILFVRRAIWRNLLGSQSEADPRRLTAIHPESYLWNARRPRGHLTTTYEGDLDVYYGSVNRKAHPQTAYGPEFPAPRQEA